MELIVYTLLEKAVHIINIAKKKTTALNKIENEASAIPKIFGKILTNKNPEKINIK